MKNVIIILLISMFLVSENSKAQTVVEFGLKPLETFHRNFELNLGIGNKKTIMGICASYRFSNQDSGYVGSGGTGLAGGYSWRYNNNLYNSYTVGIYGKHYFGKALSNFVQVDLFYRNWSFENKPARYKDEKYSFDAVRTDNVDVYCMKLLYGYTFFLSKKSKGLRPYIDTYVGVGFRHQIETFETYNGEVNGVYYTYLRERKYYNRFSPQLGMRMGFSNKK